MLWHIIYCFCKLNDMDDDNTLNKNIIEYIQKLNHLYIYSSNSTQEFSTLFTLLSALSAFLDHNILNKKELSTIMQTLSRLYDAVANSTTTLIMASKQVELLMQNITYKNAHARVFYILTQLEYNIIHNPKNPITSVKEFNQIISPIMALLKTSLNNLQLIHLTKYLETLLYEPDRYDERSIREIESICNKIYSHFKSL